MVRFRSMLAAMGATALVLGGCSFASDALWPSLSGEEPSASGQQAQRIDIAPSAGETAGQPTVSSVGGPPRLNDTNFQIRPPQPGQPTGTFVGNKTVQLRDDLRRLQESIGQHNADLQTIRQRTIQNANAYHTRVGAIRSRLQVGTTPGNPILVNEWNQSQRELEMVNGDIGDMNGLSGRVAADAAMSNFLLDSTRSAFSLSGAVEEDHRQLSVLEDDVNRTVVLIDRLLTELSDDIRRQSAYVASERSDLNTLALAIKNGEFFGTSLATRAYNAPVGQIGGQANYGGNYGGSYGGPPAGAVGGRQALVVIRFDRPDVDYQVPLFNAVRNALERRPDANFDLVAVTPSGSGVAQSAIDATSARRNAQRVLRSLTEMGLPPARVTISAATAPDAASNEVRLFVR